MPPAVTMDEMMAVLRQQQEQIVLMQQQNSQMQARDHFRQRVMVSALLPTRCLAAHR